MKRSASHRPPPWVNRDLPRAPLRQPWGTAQRARVPPIDYGDGLAPHLTPTGNTEVAKCIQRCPQHTASY
jgi:hypothetical protein